MPDKPVDIPSPAMIDAHLSGAHTALICLLLNLLMEGGVLNQGDVVAKLEALSGDLMKRPGAQYTVPIVDIVRNYAAGEAGQVPS